MFVAAIGKAMFRNDPAKQSLSASEVSQVDSPPSFSSNELLEYKKHQDKAVSKFFKMFTQPIYEGSVLETIFKKYKMELVATVTAAGAGIYAGASTIRESTLLLEQVVEGGGQLGLGFLIAGAFCKTIISGARNDQNTEKITKEIETLKTNINTFPENGSQSLDSQESDVLDGAILVLAEFISTHSSDQVLEKFNSFEEITKENTKRKKPLLKNAKKLKFHRNKNNPGKTR